METNAVVSFKPAHLYADLWVHGAVDLKAFGFGLGLTLDAKLAADVFDPFHVLGEFAVGINLPWPFNKKKIEAHVKLEWKDPPVQPPIPAPLKDVAIEHFKTSTKWPLPMPTLLVPNYADPADPDGFLLVSLPNPLPDPPNNLPPPIDAPIVALDCRPSLGFARNVNDDAQVGAIVQPLNPEWEWIGDPERGQGNPAGSGMGSRNCGWTSGMVEPGNRLPAKVEPALLCRRKSLAPGPRSTASAPRALGRPSSCSGRRLDSITCATPARNGAIGLPARIQAFPACRLAELVSTLKPST